MDLAVEFGLRQTVDMTQRRKPYPPQKSRDTYMMVLGILGIITPSTSTFMVTTYHLTGVFPSCLRVLKAVQQIPSCTATSASGRRRPRQNWTHEGTPYSIPAKMIPHSRDF